MVTAEVLTYASLLIAIIAIVCVCFTYDPGPRTKTFFRLSMILWVLAATTLFIAVWSHIYFLELTR